MATESGDQNGVKVPVDARACSTRRAACSLPGNAKSYLSRGTVVAISREPRESVSTRRPWLANASFTRWSAKKSAFSDPTTPRTVSRRSTPRCQPTPAPTLASTTTVAMMIQWRFTA
ncbi:hypothetical protein [Phytohabitans houttuyneae]|uniref:hypothetical protein n=1 Tax=Phytohabitans houttuyneae TaxID=1076126 RepID=UPI0015647ABC|nr:hypothetical protein [Phytohabitans houttuyneae]